jgi:hypothetical protein
MPATSDFVPNMPGIVKCILGLTSLLLLENKSTDHRAQKELKFPPF